MLLRNQLSEIESIFAERVNSLDGIIQSVRRHFDDDRIGVSLYATGVCDPRKWVLILPGLRADVEPSLVDSDHELVERGYQLIDLSSCTIYENIESPRIAYRLIGQRRSDFLDVWLKFLFVQMSHNQIYLIRSRTVAVSYSSRDLDTFWHRAINEVALPIVKYEAGSVFIRDDKTHLLKLRGTSQLSILSRFKGGDGKAARLKKRDVFYLPNDTSWVVQSLRDRRSIYEFDKFKPLRCGRFAEVVPQHIWGRAYIPLLIKTSGARKDGGLKERKMNDYQAGVLRLVNPTFDLVGRRPRAFSWYDKFLADFIVDVNTVLTRRYLELSKSHDDIEQICHALGSEIATITRDAEFVRDVLFGSEEFAPIYDPTNSVIAPRFRRVEIALNDIKLYVDDIHFQFEKVRKIALDDELQRKSTDRLFSDVFMKLVNSADALARLYGRAKVSINNLKAARLDELPRVKGTSAAWLSVFRNLLENSVKYSRDSDVPEITITWCEEPGGVVVVDFRDNGPGVPEEERERVFLDGVRGRLALQSGEKGTGIGLAYCREVATKCGGRVDLVDCPEGARFQVRMKRVS